jgi:hypothetical protein
LLIFESSNDDNAELIMVSLNTLSLFLIKNSSSVNSFDVRTIFSFALVAVLFNKSSSKSAIESFNKTALVFRN